MDDEGYYEKFTVIRRSTGEEITETRFVLIPGRDEHARVAMRAYADSCEGENPGLAEDLRRLAR